jgi:hypothetical protein
MDGVVDCEDCELTLGLTVTPVDDWAFVSPAKAGPKAPITAAAVILTARFLTLIFAPIVISDMRNAARCVPRRGIFPVGNNPTPRRVALS